MVYSHRSRASRYKCSKCKRTLTIDDATWRTVTDGADFIAAVQRAGWSLAPEILCALHAATAEAYAKPDYRRTGYLAAMSATR